MKKLFSSLFIISSLLGIAQQNVGIGTNDPKSKLDVKGGITIGNTYSGVNTAPANGAIIEGSVGIGTSSPDTKSVLDIVSNSKGVYLPRLTNSEVVILGATLNTSNKGLLVFNTTNNRAEFWDGTAWKAIGEGAGGPPSGTAGGDLTGTYPSPTIATGAVTSTKILDGTITNADLASPAVDLTTKVFNTLPVTNGGTGNSSLTANGVMVGNGTSSVTVTSAPSSGQVLIGNSSGPSAPAFTSFTGDIASISGAGNVTLANTTVTPATYGTATQVPTITVDSKGRITSASNTAISGIAPSGTAGGDLSGTYPNPTVDGLQGNAVSSTTPATNDVLTWTGSTWAPANKGIPTGGIIMWSGTEANIPSGWALCDGGGSPARPDLRDRFVLGVTGSGGSYDVGTSGGSNSLTLTTAQLPSHTHTGTTASTAPTLSFTGTAATITPTASFSGTAATITPTASFSGTAATITPSATFSGTLASLTHSGSFSGTGATITPSASFSGTNVSLTHSASFTGSNGSTSSNGTHSHTYTWRTCCRGYWSGYNGNNETAHNGTTTGTTSSAGAHTHTFTPAGTVSVTAHNYTPAGSVSVTGASYTPAGSISVSAHSYTPAGSVSVTGAAYTPAGSVSVTGASYTPAGSVSVTGASYTPAGTISGSGHTHTFTTNATGSGSAIDNRPAFYKLAFIIKL